MCKIFFYFGLIFILFGFWGCDFWNDPSVETEYAVFTSEQGILMLYPDYESRIINVEYQAAETESVIEGDIGGENFDRFEEILLLLRTDLYPEGNCQVFEQENLEDYDEYFYVYDVKDILADEGRANFICKDFMHIDDLSNFYSDIVALFTEDIY